VASPPNGVPASRNSLRNPLLGCGGFRRFRRLYPEVPEAPNPMRRCVEGIRWGRLRAVPLPVHLVRWRSHTHRRMRLQPCQHVITAKRHACPTRWAGSHPSRAARVAS
jgi:hypothetical protein